MEILFVLTSTIDNSSEIAALQKQKEQDASTSTDGFVAFLFLSLCFQLCIGTYVNLFGELCVLNNGLDVGFFHPSIDRCRLVAGIFNVHEGRVGQDLSVPNLFGGCTKQNQKRRDMEYKSLE